MSNEVNPWVAAAAASAGTSGLMGLLFKTLLSAWVKGDEEFKDKIRHDLEALQEKTRDEYEALMRADAQLELKLEGMKLLDQKLTSLIDRVQIDHNRLSRVEDSVEKVRWIVESCTGKGPIGDSR